MSDSVGSNRLRRKRSAQPPWTDLPDQELLGLRLKDLGVSIRDTWLEECLGDLNQELSTRGIRAHAHAWVSDEWFSPGNTTGISFPFYLTHPRLVRLERKMMREVEGGTRRECMQILRHEAGHVIQHAYVLHRRRRWQTLFGSSSRRYPTYYRPDPASKDFVQHLRRWYAQSHPDEDFAETFAVWLTPRSTWRKRYADWPALEKLEYVDELMSEIAGRKPIMTKRVEVDPVDKLTITLGEHYEKKLAHYATDAPRTFDRDLQRIFSSDPRHHEAPPASTFIRRNRAKIKLLASKRTDEPEPSLDTLLDDMTARCRALKLRAPGGEQRLRGHIVALLTDKAVRSLYSASRRPWFAL